MPTTLSITHSLLLAELLDSILNYARSESVRFPLIAGADDCAACVKSVPFPTYSDGHTRTPHTNGTALLIRISAHGPNYPGMSWCISISKAVALLSGNCAVFAERCISLPKVVAFLSRKLLYFSPENRCISC
eukprot:4299283-Pleurochrysis_carterae.AAC.1